jgi:transposase-like protein
VLLIFLYTLECRLSYSDAIAFRSKGYKCQSCGRQFVDNPTNKVISSPTKDLIVRLLLEKISLAGIARSTGVSQKWLQD